jgi:hypothetical protein
LRRVGKGRLFSAVVGLLLLYVIGVFVRGHYGIAVSIRNNSGRSLQEVHVQVLPRGKEYILGQVGDRERVQIFVQTKIESHVAVMFTDAAGTHVETVVGYFESGYCGKAEIKIFPAGKVRSTETIDPIWCKKSWLDFL